MQPSQYKLRIELDSWLGQYLNTQAIYDNETTNDLGSCEAMDFTADRTRPLRDFHNPGGARLEESFRSCSH
jgi:hypothetical protein